MEKNNMFSLYRFILLGRQSLFIYRKLIVMGLVGFAGVLFISLMFIQSKSDLSTWEIKNYMMFLYFFFLTGGILFSSLSFPAFRSKEKSITYLLLPASSSEKFVFEFLTKIVLFIIVMPLLFWVVVNLEGALMHNYYPEFMNYKFSFKEAYYRNSYGKLSEWWTNFLIIQGVLFAFTFSFTGASHFSKSPLVKTLFTFSVLVAGFSLIVYILNKELDLSAYRNMEGAFFIKNEDDTFVFGGLFLMAVNLSLLGIAFFRLKEKEV